MVTVVATVRNAALSIGFVWYNIGDWGVVNMVKAMHSNLNYLKLEKTYGAALVHESLDYHLVSVLTLLVKKLKCMLQKLAVN